MPPTQLRGEQIQDGTIDSADIDDSLEKEFTKVRATTNDSTPDFLSSKLVAGTNVTISVVGASGSNQTLAISSSVAGVAAITGGTITGITDLAIADGGTGASTAGDARTNLGLAIGTNVQAYSSVLDSVTASTYTGSNSITNLGTITAGTWTAGTIDAIRGGTGQSTYVLGDTLYATSPTTLARLSGNTASARRFLQQTGTGAGSSMAPSWDAVTKTDVGLSNVENTALSTWAGSTNVTTLGTVTAGSWNATPVPLLYGGTGATTAAGALAALSGTVGVYTQGYSAALQGIGGTWTPGVYTNDRWLYAALNTGSVGLGLDVLNRRAYVGAFGPSAYGFGYNLVLYVANTGSIQIDAGTHTIHPFSSSHTASDLGTAALPFRNVIYSGVLTSSIATGTSPFSITSTTEVANLNASRVAGKIPTGTPAAFALPLAETSGRLNPGWVKNNQNLVDGATINWDMALGTNATVILGGTGRTMALPTNLPATGSEGLLIIVQDSGGSKTITSWNGIFKWPGGTAITLSTGANKRDVIQWYYDGTSILMLSQNKNY